MDVIEREIAQPTDQWKARNAGRFYETEDGAYQLYLATYRDVLLDMGYIDLSQAHALDRYALMRYVATRFIGAKTTALADIARSIGGVEDDLPTLRDGFVFIVQRMAKPDIKTINLIADSIPPDSNILSIRYAMTALSPEIDRSADRLLNAIELFDKRRKDLIDARP